MIFFGRKKMAAAVALFVFMGACGWFWRHREYIPFISQPLSIGAAPFNYTVSKTALSFTQGLDLLSGVWETGASWLRSGRKMKVFARSRLSTVRSLRRISG